MSKWIAAGVVSFVALMVVIIPAMALGVDPVYWVGLSGGWWLATIPFAGIVLWLVGKLADYRSRIDEMNHLQYELDGIAADLRIESLSDKFIISRVRNISHEIKNLTDLDNNNNETSLSDYSR